MTLDLTTLDAHEAPPDSLRAQWKVFSKTERDALLGGDDIDELTVEGGEAAGFVRCGVVTAEKQREAFRVLGRGRGDVEGNDVKDAVVWHHPLLPGLLLVPSLLPKSTQRTLLDTLVHRELSNQINQTNMHLHFKLPYPSPSEESFFSRPPTSASPLFEPKDPSLHKPFTTKQVLERKLHWVTLGGQYDWTNRVYPELEASLITTNRVPPKPPTFPTDVAAFLQALFPETRPEAAIVNFYTPGDTMMMHRDVSERTDKGLISLSLGCDALFMIAPPSQDASTSGHDNDTPVANSKGTEGEKEKKDYLLLRLRSGDAMYMTNESRSAWHGVPKVLKGTCPVYLADWPAVPRVVGDGGGNGEGEEAEEEGEYEAWRGWMRNKRVNLNVRQMTD